MTWVEFPKRLRTALKALSVLAGANGAMLSQEIAEKIGVTRAETAKVLQLLVWGGFVGSRRGSKGGFHLSRSAGEISTGSVIEFFLARHPADEDASSPVMRALRATGAPCQEAFSKLTIADIASSGSRRKVARVVRSGRLR